MNNDIVITYYIDLNYTYFTLKLNLFIMLKYSSKFKAYEYVLGSFKATQ